MMAIVSPTAARVAATAARPSSSSRGSSRILTARKPSSRMRRTDSARADAGRRTAARGVGRDRLDRTAEEGGHRHACDLAGDVPEGDLEGPVAPGVEVDGLQRPHVASDGQRILPDEEVLEGLEAVHRVARPDAHHALVGLDPHERDREARPWHGIPGGREGRFERDPQALDVDGADLHGVEPVSPTALPAAWPAGRRG